MKAIILLSVVVMAISCQKNQLTYTEKRVVGAWEYDKVDFTKKWTIGPQNVTNDYQSLVMVFNDDFTANLSNNQSGDTWTGIWEVNQINSTTPNGQAVNAAEQLIVALTNDQTGEMIQLVWDNLSITNKRMYTNSDTKDGFYNYRLKKI